MFKLDKRRLSYPLKLKFTVHSYWASVSSFHRQHFQFLLFVAHAVCIGVDGLQWATDPASFWRGKVISPAWPFPGSFVISIPLTSLVSLILYGSLTPTSEGIVKYILNSLSAQLNRNLNSMLLPFQWWSRGGWGCVGVSYTNWFDFKDSDFYRNIFYLDSCFISKLGLT